MSLRPWVSQPPGDTLYFVPGQHGGGSRRAGGGCLGGEFKSQAKNWNWTGLTGGLGSGHHEPEPVSQLVLDTAAEAGADMQETKPTSTPHTCSPP